jgi:hypothetical protein
MSIDLTPAGNMRVLREHLRTAGLPTDDRTVVELANRSAARAAGRAEQVERLRALFGPAAQPIP